LKQHRSRTEPALLGIVGPTGVGKTELAVELALRLGDTHLVNADSRQIIAGLRAGTCTPTAEELRGVPCHLLDLAQPGQLFTVADWLVRARAVIDELHDSGLRVVLVGGSGLYIDALVDGFQLTPVPDAALRRRREERARTPAGLAVLADELRGRDPEGASSIDLANPRRVIRALEILDSGVAGLRSRRREGGRDALLVGLDAPRDLHLDLLRRRAERLVLEGELLIEVERKRKQGVSDEALARSGIGYSEALAVLERSLSRQQAVLAIVQRTWRYAQAQRTWFRRRSDVRWLHRVGPAMGEEPVNAALELIRSERLLDAVNTNR
jgi:tRNA dimethylallyltransferase